MSTSRRGSTDPRYRPSPSSSGGWPTVGTVPPELARRAQAAEDRWHQLAESPGCQWQARGVRCVSGASEVVRSRHDALRSTCPGHLAAWLRTGAELV